MHTVDNLVIHCIDFRFRPKLIAWIDASLDGQADLVVLAGASKAIIDDLSQATVLRQIEIARDLHAMKTVHIIDHIDCGAYGGSSQHSDKAAEIAMHHERLAEAVSILQEKFPQLAVETHIIDFDAMIS